jgi:predicted alpha/beta superfamily hydrolase
MRVPIVLTILFLFMVNAPPTLMQDNAGIEVDLSPIVVPDTQTILLTSAINGHNYQLSIALPASYTTSDQSYPVLYLLDPSASFLSVTEFVRYSAFWSELPELIVVGIGYHIDHIDELFPLRNRDYAISQDEFLEFISEELMPLVDSTYRTDTTDRALVGFSAGGDFVIHTIVTQPDLFNRYIAIDSSYGELSRLFGGYDTAFRASLVGLNIKLFYAATGTERLSTMIQNEEYEGLEATGLSLGSVTHVAALPLSLPAGIMAVYAD